MQQQLDTDTCIGLSDSFAQVLEIVDSIAPRDCAAVLLGESGTGKEMIARRIHHRSHRAHAPFVPVDCTNLTGELFASQLFGHVKGAFTGADRDTIGFFRAADNGTIFLDEIGELSPAVQSRLLRVLQEGQVTPLGATRSFPVNVRLVCATNRNLEEMVRRQTFRGDLYYRISVINIHLPPLRNRPDDILPLAHYFLQRQASFYEEPIKKLDEQASHLLCHYAWPGNVRELANAIEHAFVISNSPLITPDDLPENIRSKTTDRVSMALPTLDQANRELLTRALNLTGGRKRRAARLLGLEHRRFNRMIDRLGVDIPDSTPAHG